MRYFIIALLGLALLWPESDAKLVRIRRIRRLVGSSERDAQITDYRVSPLDEQGVFKYAFKTSNGIDVQAAGTALETIGIYTYISPEGQTIETRYIADELGFHVVGRHLPQPPPIPDYILRSLEYIRTHTEDGKLKPNVF
ncbi:pupal cuticle protein Edg-78E [Drosophila guanche]|uniref:Blast:Pupal cuticle protein Edg-78E n=1 Tax=Drosophila guanche TaxID=7266 RepID=A0A3B0KND3_DROGU|nr:pupal cuticle protein Edg-78E [Drosophila guanche]SPP85328.1 blast:Pupal cuticle protein Edg-78E [Drosophila guanche]